MSTLSNEMEILQKKLSDLEKIKTELERKKHSLEHNISSRLTAIEQHLGLETDECKEETETNVQIVCDNSGIYDKYHTRCKELSKDGYDIWLIEKGTYKLLLYSEQYRNQIEPALVPLDELKICLERRKRAQCIMENDQLMIYALKICLERRKRAQCIMENDQLMIYARFSHFLTRDDRKKLELILQE